MASVYRRVILKPPGLSDSDSARLADLLVGAVDLQRELAAKSLHVLQLAGQPVETSRAFYIEHEPAEPIPADSIWDPSAPRCETEQLLRRAAALLDALQTTHDLDPLHPKVHGGLCPGAILRTPDGIDKVSDFGLAQAVCTALGTAAYLNLAVSPRADGPPELQGTGVWEVLPADEFERQDRICAFVDPQKYDTRVLAGFEPGSDTIAAGFLLHLWAEHQHPYLHADPDAHRLVEMSEFMAMSTYNNARRDDLAGSDDPAISTWCELVHGMLARVPKDRLPTPQLARTLAEHVPPLDAQDILRGRIEKLDELVEQKTWHEVRTIAGGIASSNAAPPEFKERAGAALRVADAYVAIERVAATLEDENWPTADPQIKALLTSSDLPPDVRERAQKALKRLQHNLDVQRELDRIDSGMDRLATDDPASRQSQLRDLVASLDELPPPDSLLRQVQSRLEESRARLTEGLQAATNELQQALEDDRQRATEWVGLLDEAVQAEEWEQAIALVDDEPQLAHWPEDQRQRADQIIPQVESIRRERSELERARQWLDELGQAVEEERWAASADILAQRPDLEHWPPEAPDEEAIYREEIEQNLEAIERDRRRIEVEHRRARAWLQRAQAAAEKNDWTEAQTVLSTPPDVDHIPKDVRDEVEALNRTCHEQLGQVVLARLQQRTEGVRKLAESFINDLIAAELSRFVQPAGVMTSIDAEQFSSSSPMASGSAELSVRLQDRDAVPDEGTINCPFDFQLDADPPRICDDDGELAHTLTDGLADLVSRVQALRLHGLLAVLRRGGFPDARLDFDLVELSERVTATVDFLGAGAAETTAAIDVAWNPRTLQWEHVNPDGFTKAAALATASVARRTVLPELLQGSAFLRKYRSVIELDVDVADTPSTEVLGRLPTLEALLSIAPGRSEERHPFVTLPVSCAKIAPESLKEDSSTAEERLKELIAATQKTSRDGIAADLRDRIAAASAQVRLSAKPPAIDSPVDQVSFSLKAGRTPPVTLTAAWDIPSFSFHLARGTEESIKKVLAAAPRAGRPVRKIAFAVAALAVVVAGGLVARSRLTDRGPQTVVDNRPGATTQPGDGGTATPTPTAPPLDGAVGEITQIYLASSAPFTAANITQLIGAPDASAMQIDCTIPGLANTLESVGIEAPVGAPAAQLVPGDRTTLLQRITELEDLLNNEPAQRVYALAERVLDEPRFSPFIDRGNTTAWFDPPVEWTLSEDGEAWTATDAQARVVFTPVPDPTNPTAGAAQIELANIAVQLEVTRGRPTFARGSSQLRQELADVIGQRLVQLQRNSQQSLQDALATRAGAIAPTVQASPDPLETASGSTQVTVESSLQPRVFRAAWNRSRLRFNWEASAEGTWQQRIDRMVLAAQTVQLINSRPEPAQDWLGASGAGLVSEILAPAAAGVWTLAAPAPWATAPDPAKDLPEAERLAIEVAWPATAMTAEDLAGEILANARPAYWPLVIRYSEIAAANNPRLLQEAARAASAGAPGPGSGVLDYLRSEPRYVVPEATLTSARRPQLSRSSGAGPIDSLQLPLDGRWALADTPPGIDATGLAAQLQDSASMPAVELIVGLQLSPAGQPEFIDLVGSLAGLTGTLGNAQALEERLGRIGQRQALEGLIEQQILGGDDSKTLDEVQTMSLLTEIWTIKGGSVGNIGSTADLAALMRGRRTAVRFPDVSRPGDVLASIPVEYFCGPTNCYAIAWSIGRQRSNATIEPPTLLRLCPTSDLSAAWQSNGSDAGLGESLFASVFGQAVPEGIRTRSSAEFGFQIGLVLAFDDPMWLIPGVEDLSFTQQRSYLKPAGQFEALEEERLWSTLRELRAGQYRSDYLRVRVLSEPARLDADLTAEERWAAGAILRLAAPTAPGIPP